MDDISKNNTKIIKSVGLWKSILSTFLSRKLFALLISFGLIWLVHEITIDHLYTLNAEHQTTAVTTIYVATLSVLGVLVAAYMGTNAIQSKFGISGVAQLVSQSLTEKREEKIDENINITEERVEKIIQEYSEKYKNDPSYRPIQPDTEEEFR